MERQGPWSSNKCVEKMLESVVGPGVYKRSRLPDDVRCSRLKPHEVRRAKPEGMVIVDETTGEETPVFPPGWDPRRQVLLANHTIDRCSIGAAGVAFCIYKLQLIWAVHWGILHDGWNAVKHGCKRACGGIVWMSVVKVSAVCNLSFKPFRSGAWRKRMQQVLRHLSQSLTPDDPEFQEVACAQQELMSPGDGAQGCDFDASFKYFCKMPSCCPDGDAPVCKFARWFSVSECWDYYRPQWCLLKPVLRALAQNKSDDTDAVVTSTTSMWDVELANATASANTS